MIRVADHLEAEASISACVPQRPRRRPSNRQPAEHERARIERDLLTPLVACRADEFDGPDAFLLAFGGKELYVVIVCQLTHYGLHVLHTRVAGPVVWRSEDRRDPSASFYVIVCKVVFNYRRSGRKGGLNRV